MVSLFSGAGTRLLLFFALSYSAAQAGPWVPRAGEFYLQGAYATQSANGALDNAGGEQPLADGAEYIEQRAEFYGEIGLGRRFALIVSAPYQWSRLKQTSLGDLRSSGVGDARLGLRVALLRQSLVLAAEVDGKWAVDYEQGAAPALSDGQTDYELRLLGGTSWVRHAPGYLQAELGYRRREGDPADEWIYGADVGLWGTPSLLAAVGLQGVRSRGELSFQQPEMVVFSPGIAESYHTAAVQLRYRARPGLEMFLAYSRVIEGKNTLQLSSWRVGVALRR